ncbi:hypothetical protein DC366_05475 [Pelagivirga sediminicola]|uniref:Uncharacterized protein n=1 Tax=Pelagivirga sediminicola TaxID=2170575 RepID=A0A2T7G9V4_9RHOB|nr:hypothetical protein DC366_05475 [Pelagivirga sediminicola]
MLLLALRCQRTQPEARRSGPSCDVLGTDPPPDFAAIPVIHLENKRFGAAPVQPAFLINFRLRFRRAQHRRAACMSVSGP